MVACTLLLVGVPLSQRAPVPVVRPNGPKQAQLCCIALIRPIQLCCLGLICAHHCVSSPRPLLFRRALRRARRPHTPAKDVVNERSCFRQLPNLFPSTRGVFSSKDCLLGWLLSVRVSCGGGRLSTLTFSMLFFQIRLIFHLFRPRGSLRGPLVRPWLRACRSPDGRNFFGVACSMRSFPCYCDQLSPSCDSRILVFWSWPRLGPPAGSCSSVAHSRSGFFLFLLLREREGPRSLLSSSTTSTPRT